RLESDDALDVYFTRAIEILQSSPLINSFFMEIAVRMMNEEKSIYNENVRKSPYFTKVWEYYQKYFNVTNKKVMSELKVTGGD
ncbi:TPA: hypothetical protein ACSP82_004047, partial [Aeromonas veronii]